MKNKKYDGLHMGALAAVTYYKEFKTYYKRKLAEGKPKMLVLNNGRNRIILRLAAVIQKINNTRKWPPENS